MLIPCPAETLTLYLDADFVLNYSIGLDLTSCTLYSQIVNENGAVVASFVFTNVVTGVPSSFTRSLSRSAMATAGLQANLRYKTDLFVKGYSGASLVDKVVSTGLLTVKDSATVVP